MAWSSCPFLAMVGIIQEARWRLNDLCKGGLYIFQSVGGHEIERITVLTCQDAEDEQAKYAGHGHGTALLPSPAVEMGSAAHMCVSACQRYRRSTAEVGPSRRHRAHFSTNKKGSAQFFCAWYNSALRSRVRFSGCITNIFNAHRISSLRQSTEV